jgi:hypothetical protein
MARAVNPLAFPLLWFTSRTPTVVGQTHCRMDRYLGYHAGAHGTGYRHRAQSVPLATGSGVHVGAELILEWIQEYQTKHRGMPPMTPPLEVVAWGATEAAARYEHRARKRGFLEKGLEAVGADDGDTVPTDVKLSPALEYLIAEQKTLIEAQVWIYGMIVLPQLLSKYRILDVEREESLVLDCTCGLGEAVADWTLHHDRDCEGIVQMGRADALLEGWADDVRGKIGYDEIKTKATPNMPWEKAWEHSGQLRVNMETASRRLGKRVDHAHIVTLFKGKRERDRNDPTSQKEQSTPLIYGYFDEGSPGFRPAQWKAQYKWTDDYGKGHTLPRDFRRRPIWDEDVDLPMLNTRPQASRVERWVTGYLTPQQWPLFAKVLGPFPHQVNQLPETLLSVLAEETDWRQIVAQIRLEVAAQLKLPAKDRRSEIEIAAQYVTRSWQCTSFGGEPCSFKPVCDKNPGWQDLETMGHYEIRTPHHATEKEAHEALGIEFPPGDEDEGDDDWE